MFIKLKTYLASLPHSSVNTPKLDLGCKKPIFSPSAPFLETLSINFTPFSSASFKEAFTSSVANAIWWIPCHLLAINFATGLFSSVASSNSILVSPILKKAVFTI